MRPELRVGVVYDFRNPPHSGIDNPSFYAELLDQAVWLEGLGLNLIWFTEHHFVEDGYLPSWIPVASAMAARTKRVRFSSDISILPLYHPVRLAEDLAVLDNLSRGRVDIGVGLGYVPRDFAGYGYPVSHRVSRTDEGLEILSHCFGGEQFSFTGKRYQTKDVLIRPEYVQEGGPPLWIAASSREGALRAARFNAHLLPKGLSRLRPKCGSMPSAPMGGTRTIIAWELLNPFSSPTTETVIGPRSVRLSGSGWSITRRRSRRPGAAHRQTRTRNALIRTG